MPLAYVRPEDLAPGDYFFHGYGWGTFIRLTQRPADKVIHYRSDDGKKRSVRWEQHRWAMRA